MEFLDFDEDYKLIAQYTPKYIIRDAVFERYVVYFFGQYSLAFYLSYGSAFLELECILSFNLKPLVVHSEVFL